MVLGHAEPRVHTAPLRELTPETSLGFSVIEFAEDVLEVELLPWEKWLFVHALEITGNFGGEWRFRFRKVVVLVARQNGKTLMSVVLSAYFLYVLEVALILGTSADLDKAEEVWTLLLDGYIERIPDLHAELAHVYRKNGRHEIRLRGNRRYKIAAVMSGKSSKGGRGDSNDLVLLDELREHQEWDAWRATTKSTNARPYGLVWCMTNAGTIKSIVLRSLRVKAHAMLGDPDGIAKALEERIGKLPDDAGADDTLGWFEWSAAPWRDVLDRDGWAEANPSLGYGFMEERTLLGAATEGDEIGFRTECLCQFVEKLAEPAFPGESWERGTDEGSEIPAASPLFFGIDLSADRTTTSIAVCGVRQDGQWHVEVVARDIGTDWALRWIADRADPLRPMSLAWQKNGAPISALGDQIKAIPGVVPHELAGAALLEGFDRFWSGIAASDPEAHQDVARIMHRPQPALDHAARVAAMKKKGDGGKLMDRNGSPGDIAPLIACVMAHATATTPEEPEKPKTAPSAYNDGHDMLVV